MYVHVCDNFVEICFCTAVKLVTVAKTNCLQSRHSKGYNTKQKGEISRLLRICVHNAQWLCKSSPAIHSRTTLHLFYLSYSSNFIFALFFIYLKYTYFFISLYFNILLTINTPSRSRTSNFVVCSLTTTTKALNSDSDSNRRRSRRRHPPVLRAVDAQRVRVRVFALHRQVAGGVARLLAHHAEAVHAGHLRRGLAATQPREEPAHLVRQVVCATERRRQRKTV